MMIPLGMTCIRLIRNQKSEPLFGEEGVTGVRAVFCHEGSIREVYEDIGGTAYYKKGSHSTLSDHRIEMRTSVSCNAPQDKVGKPLVLNLCVLENSNIEHIHSYMHVYT